MSDYSSENGGPAPVIEIRDLTKTYLMGQTEVHALRGVSLTICEGEYVAIVGASGSGKSTLMNMIGLLDRSTSGSYRIREEVSRLSRNRMADLRNREIGFVFQSFNLLARTSARRQVQLPLFYAGVSERQSARRASRRCSAGWRLRRPPDELSGGQQQRAAIARFGQQSEPAAGRRADRRASTLGPAKNSWRFSTICTARA